MFEQYIVQLVSWLIAEIIFIVWSNQENLKVKSQFKTIQTAEELEAAFTPGAEFGFNVVVDIEKSDAETTSSSSS